MSKVKKLSVGLKITIILAVFAVAFSAFIISTSVYTVKRADAAVKAIGTVTYTDESKEKIDIASEYVDEIGVNGLSQSTYFSAPFISLANVKALNEKITEAKKEYVRLAIKTAVVADQRKYAENYSDEEISEIIADARRATDEYFKDDYEDVETYSSLTELEERYGVTVADDDSSAEQPQEPAGGEEEIELC